jgi:hypothetical protein
VRVGVRFGPFWISGRAGGRRRRSRAASGPSARDLAAKRKRAETRAGITEALVARDVERAAKLSRKAARTGLYVAYTDYSGRAPLTVNFVADPARKLPGGWQWVGR